MQILFVSWWWPYPASNGAKIRIYNLLRHLGAKHKVTLLSFAESDEATDEQVQHLRSFCEHVEALPKPRYQPGNLKAVLGYASRWPRSLVDVYSPQMAVRIQEMVQQQGIEIIVVSELQCMRYLEVAPHIPGILEEIEITYFHDQVEQASSTSGRLRAQLTLSKLEGVLRNLMARGVSLTVVSESERKLIQKIAPHGVRIEVIPNGVDTETNSRDATTLPEPFSLIYTGSITYHANYDAVAYFIREVLPLIRQRMPQVQFSVTGGTGSIDISDLEAQPGVTFTGYLPSIADAVRRSWAAVVPLRQGGGTRLKILEAMALGTPVISTTKGAEGLDVHPGSDILIADSPTAMANAVCDLLSSPQRRAEIAQAGRALVEKQYDWKMIANSLMNLIEQHALKEKV